MKTQTAGLLFYGYVLFSCGNFVFYRRKEELGFICPHCGVEAVRGRIFKVPITHEDAKEIVAQDVERCFCPRIQNPMVVKETTDGLEGNPRWRH